GDPVAKLVLTIPGRDPLEVPLLAGAAVERLGLFGRLGTALEKVIHWHTRSGKTSWSCSSC
ncbi:MAG: hypothetical protein ACE10K_02790, partial [Rhodothermales bacterium]